MRAYLLYGMALASIGSAARAQSADTTCSRSLLGVNCRTQYYPAVPTYNVWDGLRDLGAAMQRDRQIKAMEQQAAEIAALRADLAAQRAQEQAEENQMRNEMLASANISAHRAARDGRCDDAAMIANAFGIREIAAAAPSWCSQGQPKTYPSTEMADSALAHRVLIKWGLDAYNGNGVAQDRTLAATYFRLAANQGNAKAQYNLALMYGRGDGVAQSDSEARRLLSSSAAQGITEAQEVLALMPKPAPKRAKAANRKR